MSSSLTNPLSEPLPAYLVKINSTAFHPKKCNLMQRTKLEVIPKYWRQLEMDQKRISPSCEDRLSELTTNQIDRIIDMEKIQSSLQAKKKKEEEVFFTFKPKNQNSHPNTYQACFLAKINQIAIKRNIRHESADLGIYVGSADQSSSRKKIAPVPFKYAKEYKLDSKDYNHRTSHHAEEDDEKSISSIEDDLERFEQRLEHLQKSRKRGGGRRRTTIGGTMRKKWFYGLTDKHIKKPAQPEVEQSGLERSFSIDIESQVSPIKWNLPSKKGKFHSKSVSTRGSDIQSSRQLEPLERYRLQRVVTVE